MNLSASKEREGREMKAIDEILNQTRLVKSGVSLKDYYGVARPATIAIGMTAADFDGIGNENEYIPGLNNN